MPSLTRFVLRHKALVALFWLVVAVAGVLTVSGTTQRLTNDFSMPGQAFKVDNQIVRAYGNGASQTPFVPVLTAPAGQRISDPAVAAQTGGSSGPWPRRSRRPGSRTTRPRTTRRSSPGTGGRRSHWCTPRRTGSAARTSTGCPARARAGRACRWKAGVTGTQLLDNGSAAASNKGTGIMAEAMIGALGALAILAFVYASFLALLPLLIGGISVMATFLVVGGLTEITGISQIVEFLIALIGLGVAIDYSLLVVSRWREERAAGRDNAAAVVEAMNHAGRAVIFSGLTVADRAAVDDRAAGPHAAQRRLRRRARPARVRRGRGDVAAGDPGNRRTAPRLAATAHRAHGEQAVLGLGAAACTGTAGSPPWPGSLSSSRSMLPALVPAPG